MMKTEPAVFVVRDTYHIMVPVTNACMMWVKVGEKCYYDDSNGILRSASRIHRMIIPKGELDEAGEYRIFEEDVIERKAYFTQTGEIRESHFTFTPVKSGPVRCYHISDAHNREAEPIRAAQVYGDIDFLILNGDIPNDSDNVEHFDSIYVIAAAITHGRIPVVCTRGNHDLRGVCAELIADYLPNDNGRTYYTFRLGDIWGMVLDCGEDKDDSHIAYGHTICCHDFRLRQSRFIKQVINNSSAEYEAEGIKHKIVITHNPFTRQCGGEFSIEAEIYSEWARLLQEYVQPEVMICGHKHGLDIYEPGGDKDHLGQPCPIVTGGDPGEGYFAGVGYLFGEAGVEVTFTDSDGRMLRAEKVV